MSQDNSPIVLETIDAHTAGEPLRVITAGIPPLKGDDILAKRAYMRANYDHLRRALMLEPRGHADMYGAVITEPVTEDGDLGVLFLHNEGYSTMCGHGIIALTKVIFDEGLLSPKEHGCLRFDTPAGRVTAFAEFGRDGKVFATNFLNVPSFLDHEGRVQVEGLGEVPYTLGFGGAYYAYVDARPLGLSLDVAGADELIKYGRAIKHAVAESIVIEHPEGKTDMEFVYGTIFIGDAHGDAHSRNVCIFADGEVDRSPTGTGVSGRVAIHHARDEVKLEETIEIESILGTSFHATATEQIDYRGRNAIIPRVRGRAWITGRCRFEIAADDPLAGGFMLR
jgi:trans-L-3-hydroxyproline dehydratase